MRKREARTRWTGGVARAYACAGMAPQRRFIFWKETWAAAMFALLPTGGAWAGEFVVFDAGTPVAAVRLPVGASEEERLAGEDLARCLGAISGQAAPRVYEGGASPQGREIHVGQTERGKQALEERPLGPGEEFLVKADATGLVLAGGSPAGTVRAVYAFLQERAGARWYAPGTDGEVLPRRAALVVPEGAVVQGPAYVSSMFCGLPDAASELWARRNLLSSRYEGWGHGMERVFPRYVHAFYPAGWLSYATGGRVNAARDEFQPNFAREEVAEYAGAAVSAYFKAYPQAQSYGLGLNDNVMFDASAETRRVVEPLRWFRRRPDFSGLVFGFMNRVAERVATEHPQAYLGCLAYFWCENVPDFPVHPNVLPWLTADRSQYYDPAFRAEDLELIRRWGRSGCRTFGLYEYAYGYPFVVPRQFFAAQQESLQVAWEAGARAYVAEAYPEWPFDAPKLWVTARLLWKPQADVYGLLREFCQGYYGPASDPMMAFFRECEAAWAAQPGRAVWIKHFHREEQAVVFPEPTRARLRGYLEAARAACRAEGERGEVALRHVEAVRAAFAVSEAYAAYVEVRRGLSWNPCGTDAEALRALSDLNRAAAARAELYRASREAGGFGGHAVANLDRVEVAVGVAWRVLEYARRAEKLGYFVPVLREALSRLRDTGWADGMLGALASVGAGKGEALLTEERAVDARPQGTEGWMAVADEALPKGWWGSADPAPGQVLRTEGGMLGVEGGMRVYVGRTVRVVPGKVLVLVGGLAGQMESGATATWECRFSGKASGDISEGVRSSFAPGKGEQVLVVAAAVPAGSEAAHVRFSVSNQGEREGVFWTGLRVVQVDAQGDARVGMPAAPGRRQPKR